MSLEAETRSKMEAIRQRKKLEQDIMELEAALEMTTRARAEAEKGFKKFQQQIRDLEILVDEERQATQESQDDHAVSDQKVSALSAEVHSLRSQLETSERANRNLEAELQEAAERIVEVNRTNAELVAEKKRVETEANSNQVSYSIPPYRYLARP